MAWKTSQSGAGGCSGVPGPGLAAGGSQGHPGDVLGGFSRATSPPRCCRPRGQAQGWGSCCSWVWVSPGWGMLHPGCQPGCATAATPAVLSCDPPDLCPARIQGLYPPESPVAQMGENTTNLSKIGAKSPIFFFFSFLLCA